MVGNIPKYYNAGSELLTSHYGKKYPSSDKRNKWLLNNTSTTENGKIKKATVKKTVEQSLVNNNNNLGSKVKSNNNSNNIIGGSKENQDKTTLITSIEIEKLLQNPFINDKKAFCDWIHRAYKKQDKQGFSNNISITSTSNYYDIFTTNDNEDISFKEQQQNTENNNIMPLLAQKPIIAPVFETTTITNPTLQDDNDESKWTQWNQKDIDKELKATTDFVSYRYLPKILIDEHFAQYEIQPTSLVIPLSIKVSHNKNPKFHFRNSRIVYAILGAMQKAFPDTYLGPLTQDPKLEIIYNIKDIPLEIGNIKDYLATPINQKQGLFIGKVYIHCNHPLHEYRKNGQFLEYLKQENINLDINDLDDVNPFHLGYMENIIPRHETVNMHASRIQSLLPNNAPKFQLQFGTIWSKTGDRCRVVMVKCDEGNSDELLELFEDLNNINAICFFSWSDYLSCTAEQKTTIVKKINNWRGNYRSILISGFCDNDDNVPMVYDNTDRTDDILTTTSVTDYMQYAIKNSNNENLFHHVYSPKFGMREVIVKLQNFSQATSFIKVIHGELARKMDTEAICKVFQDPDQAVIDSDKIPWRPSSRVSNIIPTYQENNKVYSTKRQRQEGNEITSTVPKTSGQTYSAVTSGTVITASTMETVTEFINFRRQIEDAVNKKLERVHASMDDTMNSVKQLKNEMVQNNITINETIKQNSEETNLAIQDIKKDVNEKIGDMKDEMVTIHDTLQSLESLLKGLVGKKDDESPILLNNKNNMEINNENSNPNPNPNSFLQKLGWGANSTSPNKHMNYNGQYEDEDMNEVVTPQKQQVGMRITRSMASKK
jgi:hypothetical protein